MLRRASRFAFHASLALLASTSTLLVRAQAQVHSGPVHQGSSSLSDVSRPVGADSGPVYESGRSVHDTGAGGLSGNAVRESVTGDVHSGPVSDVSVGAVTTGQSVGGAGAVTDAAAGAVKKDEDSPIRAGISQPLRDLVPLQEQLQAIQPLPRDTSPEDEAAAAEDAAAEAAQAIPEAEAPESDEEQAAPQPEEVVAPAPEEAAPEGDAAGQPEAAPESD
jgi:hypothetical protein